MSFDTNWDVDRYRTDYESEEHWLLRKKFMEIHKDKFPENELVCLAQVFTNIEFMGCKYPDETMELVANLSQDVAKEFRNERSKRIKRTFVKASDAAEAKAKGKILKPNTLTTTSSTLISTECNSSTSTTSTQEQSQKKKNEEKEEEEEEINQRLMEKRKRKTTKSRNTNDNDAADEKKPKIDLYSNLLYGKFVLFDCGDRNSIRMSGQKCGIKVEEIESIFKGKKRIDTLIDGLLVNYGISTNLKEAKALSFENSFKKLQDHCYIIKLNLQADQINVTKNDQTIKCNVKRINDEQRIDSTNIGFKMMQKLGWSGGGLGLKTQGIENPVDVDFLVKQNRKGLGNNDSGYVINAEYFREILLNYVKSDDIRDLHFETGFTKDERATLHLIASENNLKSSSHGKEPNRYLVISKKTISPHRILEEILINKNSMYINKYHVRVPKQKAELFPDHVNFEINETDETTKQMDS